MSVKSIYYSFFVLFIALAGCSSEVVSESNQLEVRIEPKDTVFVYEIKGVGTPLNLYNAVIQNMAIVNLNKERAIVEEVWLDVYKDGQLMQKLRIEDSSLIKTSQKFKMYKEQGVLALYDFQFRTSKYLSDISFSENKTLEENQGLISTYNTLLFQRLPDSIQINVKATNSAGKTMHGQNSLRIINHKSENTYDLPLAGRWVAFGTPSLVSHHRWGALQEFAFDFVKIGQDNKSHSGKGDKLEQYYAYGEPVFSIGDGVVVSTMNEMTESDQNLKQVTETSEEFLSRTMMAQQKLLQKGFKYTTGNYVIIEHSNNEYSYYLHLKPGSVMVKEGDRVKKGQPIGNIGHSGNSTEPHLHFHLSNSAVIDYSRSIPVQFDNIQLWPDDNGNIRHIHNGQIIETKN